MSYGELLVLSKSLLERIKRLDVQIKTEIFGERSEVTTSIKTERQIAYDMLLEVGNLRQEHQEVEAAKVIDI